MTIYLKKTAVFLGNKDVIYVWLIAHTFYFIIEWSGIFRLEPASVREILHSTPSLILSLFLVCHIGCALEVAYQGGFSRLGDLVVFYLGLLMLVLGLWVSMFTRFEGRAVRAEGESFNAFPGEYLKQSVLMPSTNRAPQVGLTLIKIVPGSSKEQKKPSTVSAEILYAGRTTGGVRQGKLGSRWPLVSDWTMIDITDFGYAPRYVLSDLSGRQLESESLYMKLFPPGAEEKFEAMFLGYLFYLKCYPDYIDDHGQPATASAVPRNPVFNLRIVRNKDIVYNDLVKPSEKVRFDNFIIAVPEVKMWVEITFVRDLGIPVAALGIVLLLAGTVLLYRRAGEGTVKR